MLLKLKNNQAGDANYSALSMTFPLRRRALKTYRKTKAIMVLKGGSAALRTPHNLEESQQLLQETKNVSVVMGKCLCSLPIMKIKNLNMCVLGSSHKQGLGPQNLLSSKLLCMWGEVGTQLLIPLSFIFTDGSRESPSL